MRRGAATGRRAGTASRGSGTASSVASGQLVVVPGRRRGRADRATGEERRGVARARDGPGDGLVRGRSAPGRLDAGIVELGNLGLGTLVRPGRRGAGAGGPGRGRRRTAPAPAAPAAPAAEPHGGGAVQSPADPPARGVDRPAGGPAAARVEPASRSERIGDSTLTGAASRRAQSTNVGQLGKEPDRQ